MTERKSGRLARPNRPKTTSARQTGIAAESLFIEACSRLGWVVSKTPLESDFGIDYRVEPVLDRLVDGIEFYAQVKGTAANPEILASTVRVSIKTAEYWRMKLVPVAIVSVNTQSSSIHYGWFDGGKQASDVYYEVAITHEFPVELLTQLKELLRRRPSCRCEIVNAR